MSSKVKKGLNLLSQEKIEDAFKLLSLEYSKNPKNLEAQIGVLLCDIASFDLQKALGLLEFYYILISEQDSQSAQKRILNLINALDEENNQENEEISLSWTDSTESLSCISYEDFKNFIFTKSNFKEAFEDFSLSTKIVFSHKEELYDFLNLLIDEGYANLSLQYAENIRENMGFDLKINQILQEALKHLK